MAGLTDAWEKEIMTTVISRSFKTLRKCWLRLFGKLSLLKAAEEKWKKKYTHTGPDRTYVQNIPEKKLHLYIRLILRLKSLLISKGLPHQTAKTGRVCSFFKCLIFNKRF